MIRLLTQFILCSCLALSVACSKREPAQADESDWSDIQPLADDVTLVPAADRPPAARAPGEDYAALAQRLKQMQSIRRGDQETLITGDRLVFDYDRRYVRMDGQVLVQDEYGELEAETLSGHFSVSNEVESIKAGNGVVIRSAGREASATSATYNPQSGEVLLVGQAQASEGGNRLAGERIQLWVAGSRRMVCEPNALLVIGGDSGWGTEADAPGAGVTEIRSNHMVYDEEQDQVRFNGNVRVRHPQAALNCGRLELNLKENNKIDWIEAWFEVIIHTDDRKALSDWARYDADTGKFVLEGNPKVKQDRNIMSGERIIFWHNARRLVCEPNARVLLYPDEAINAKFLKDLKD